jgi:sugar-phosphatase
MKLLQALPPQHWAIVTSCTRPLAGVRIGVAGLPKPRHLVTSTDVKHGKPDPEPYLKGAQYLGVPASDCIVIEDAPAGIRAGKAAGARVLALRTTATDAELQQAGSDWIVDNLTELFLDPLSTSSEFLLIRRRAK